MIGQSARIWIVRNARVQLEAEVEHMPAGRRAHRGSDDIRVDPGQRTMNRLSVAISSL